MVAALFPPTPLNRRGRPLRVMRLERRRVLSADFSLTASSLVLDGFNQESDSLAITQQGDAYLFTTDDGWNTPDGGPLPTGVAVSGETLSVQRNLFDNLSDGLTVLGNGQADLNVTLGNADFSSAAGSLTLVSPTSLGQQPLSLFTAPTEGIRLAVAPAGLNVSSLNIAGDLEVTSFGAITDAPGTQIIVTGDATFISNVGSPDGDFNGDGVVDLADRDHWSANYGLSAGTSKYDGDANGDGLVNAVDYTLWRDSLGETASGGIYLADNAGDRLEVGGSATFNSAVQGQHEIQIGVPGADGQSGWVELGKITALGSNVAIVEDAASEVTRVEAYQFSLTSSGKINVLPGAEVLVEDTATLTSRYVDYQADFNEDGIVDDLDYAAWRAGYGTTDAARADGDANGDGRVNAVDYAMWRDGRDAYDLIADPTVARRGGITFADGARFEAGGLVTLVARDGDLPEDRFEITVNDAATARFGSLAVDGGKVKVVEDAGAFKPARDGNQDGTVIAGIEAQQLLLISYGPITTANDADIVVSGGESVGLAPDATFAATGSITLADAVGKDLQIDGEATFLAGSETSVPSQSIRVGVDAAGMASDANFNAGGIRFHATGEVRIAEDSGTNLLGWSTYVLDDCIPSIVLFEANLAGSLEIQSDGRITDADDAGTTVDGDATFRVTADSLTGDAPAIQLANPSSRPFNGLTIQGYATFLDSTDKGIDIGNAGDGEPTDTAFDAGQIRFVTGPAGSVRIVEGSDSVLGGWTNGPIDFFAGSEPDLSTANSLELLSRGLITDESDAIVAIAGDATFVAFRDFGISPGDAIRLADDNTSGTVNRLEVGETATFIHAGTSSLRIRVGVIDAGFASTPAVAASADFVAGKVRFDNSNGSVQIAEDDATDLAGWTGTSIDVLGTTPPPAASTAASLELLSTAAISDDNDAIVTVTNEASFVVTGSVTTTLDYAIRLADHDLAGTTNSLSVGDDASFVVGPGVTKPIEIGVASDGSPAEANFDASRLAFRASDSLVRIAEDDSTRLAGNLAPSGARELELWSAGAIADEAGANVTVFGNATLIANAAAANGDAIRLSDGEFGEEFFLVDGLATFVVGGDDAANTVVGGISVGVAPDGSASESIYNAGSVRFFAQGSSVLLAEDSDTVLASWTGADLAALSTAVTPSASEALRIEVTSAGSVTDVSDAVLFARRADETVATTDASASFITATDVVLSNEGTANRLVVDGVSYFQAGDGRQIDVGIGVDGTPAAADFNTGSLRFLTLGGATRIAEDSNTLIADGVSAAAKLDLFSAGEITDASDADIQIATDATFVAMTNITLADGDSSLNRLLVDGLATFLAGNGASIDVGVTADGSPAPAVFNAGSLRFFTIGGTTRIAEDSGTLFAGWTGAQIDVLGSTAEPTSSTADSLMLLSLGTITDTADANVQIDGNAQFVVAADATIADILPAGSDVQAIVLANGETSANAIEIGGLAQFVVEIPAATVPNGFNGPKGIDVGVLDSGVPAAAIFKAGSLRLFAPGGLVRIGEDDSTQIGGLTANDSSEASRLQIDSRGAITDEFIADEDRPSDTLTFTVDEWAELNAEDGQSDIVLGDGDVAFRMSADPTTDAGLRQDPALFDEGRYLAMEAFNVSVQVDSGVNLRTTEGTRPPPRVTTSHRVASSTRCSAAPTSSRPMAIFHKWATAAMPNRSPLTRSRLPVVPRS